MTTLDAKAGLLGKLAASMIAGIAVLRMLVTLVEHRVFDIDPLIDPEPMAALSSASSIGLDVLLFLGSALGFLDLAARGRRIHWSLVLLALAPAPMLLWHGLGDNEQMWRGATWVAAMWSAVAAAHLGADPVLRRLMLAILLAAGGPLAARGLLQVWSEHALTVAAFEQSKTAFFADKGWTPDSPAALIYERRLRQPEALGWFGLANIYASVMGTILVATIGLLIAAWRARLASGWTGMLVLLTLGIGAAVGSPFVNGGTISKGAIVAIALGAIIIATLVMPEAARERMTRRLRWLVPGLIGLTLIAIVLRGLLPISFVGEKSLLFRWFYVEGAAAVVRDHLWNGVGPAGFQEAFLRVRPEFCPEEPASAHNVFLDWLTAVGVWGASWIALVTLFIRRASRHSTSEVRPLQEAPSISTAFIPAALVLVVTCGVGIAVEWRLLDPPSLLTRIVGALVGLALARAALEVLARSTPTIERVIGIGGLVVLLCHAQIEMSFWQPGSVVWAAVFLGLAASMSLNSKDSASGAPDNALWTQAALRRTPALIGLALATTFGVLGGVPAVTLERELQEAARPLMIYGSLRRAAEGSAANRDLDDDVRRWAKELESIDFITPTQRIYLKSFGQTAPEPRFQPLEIDLRRLEAFEWPVRRVVIDRLERAADRPVGSWNSSRRPGPTERPFLKFAVEQCLTSASRRLTLTGDLLAYTADLVEQMPVVERHAYADSLLRAVVFQQLAAARGAPDSWPPVAVLWEWVAELDPQNWMWRKRAADAWWARDWRDRASLHDREALRLNDNFFLDPLKQMSEAERRDVERRIMSSHDAGSDTAPSISSEPR